MHGKSKAPSIVAEREGFAKADCVSAVRPHARTSRPGRAQVASCAREFLVNSPSTHLWPRLGRTPRIRRSIPVAHHGTETSPLAHSALSFWQDAPGKQWVQAGVLLATMPWCRRCMLRSLLAYIFGAGEIGSICGLRRALMPSSPT